MTLSEVRHAVLRLVREPGFTVVAAVTLALGVGANVAVFAVVNAVLLRPLPYPEADRLVIIEHLDERTGFTKRDIAIGDFVDFDTRAPSFEGLAGYTAGQVTLFTEEQPFRVDQVNVTGDFFRTLGVRPELGRVIETSDAVAGAAPVAVVSHGLWRDVLGADPAAVGRFIETGVGRMEVVGVMPVSFDFPADAGTDLFVPMAVPASAPEARNDWWTLAVGRLRSAGDLDQTNRDMEALSRAFAEEHPEQNEGALYTAVPLRQALVGDTSRALLLMLGAVGMVLLIACANVANLQLARSLARRREMAIRIAIGARTGHLVRQLLLESLALSVVATALGIGAAHVGVWLITGLIPASSTVPGLADAQLDGVVVAFAVLLAVGTSVLFGLLSAVSVRGDQARQVLVTTRSSLGRGSRRWGSALVVAEIALAVVLLLGAGLILRSFASLMRVDPGFEYESVARITAQLPVGRYGEYGARQAFYQQAFAAVESLPGVRAVGVAAITPLTGNNWTMPFERADRPFGPGERAPEVGWQVASGGFFEALQIPLVSGRLFDDRDGPDGPPIIIVSESIAERYYPEEDPVGRRVETWGGAREIVGVVGDIRRGSLEDEPRADMYLPAEATYGLQTTFFARTDGDAAAALPVVGRALRDIDPDLALLETSTMADVAGESVKVVELMLWLLIVFAGTAIVLAGVGIYGVMSYTVRQRVPEIGTRMAMGATQRDIARLVLGQGAGIAVGGVGLGLLIGLMGTRALESVLFGVSPTDPLTVAAVALAIVGTTLLASWLPARRAASVAPARTLKEG